MALLYMATASLDGYTVDTSGSFDWSAPSEEVHAFINDRQRPIGTYLYGRRMYETMRVWQDLPGPGDPNVVVDFAHLWQAASKVVFSASLTGVSTPRTRIEPRFDAELVRALVAAAPTDVSIGGPTLAAAAFRAGLVDEVELFLVPVSVGGGTPALPRDLMVRYEQREQRTFADGRVYLRYAVTAPGA